MNRRSFFAVVGTPILAPVYELLSKLETPQGLIPVDLIGTFSDGDDLDIDKYVLGVLHRSELVIPVHFRGQVNLT